jgi:hypothetical protein
MDMGASAPQACERTTTRAWMVPHDDDKDGMATGEQKELTG